MNPLTNQNSDTVWNMHDLINDLIYELKMTRGNFVSEIACGLDSERATHILNVLEYYNTLVLEEVQDYMKKYKKSLFELIQKRRMAYVEKVRSMYRRNLNDGGGKGGGGQKRSLYHYDSDGELCLESEDDTTIDLTRDQDDTANLACGMQVVSRGIKKIDRIIQKKKYFIEQDKKQEYLRWCGGTFLTFAAVFVLAYMLTQSLVYKV
jgi:hypothetical protein